MKFYSNSLTAIIDDIKYEWCGTFGCVLKSWERGVKKGQIRMIGDTIFYAYTVYPDWPFFKHEINWLPQQQVSIEFLIECKQAIFS